MNIDRSALFSQSRSCPVMAATKKYVVRGFISSWLDKSEGGVLNRTWLSSDPKDTKGAQCLVYKNIDGSYKTFSITEGYTAITQHLSGKKHKYNFNEVQTNLNHTLFFQLISTAKLLYK